MCVLHLGTILFASALGQCSAVTHMGLVAATMEGAHVGPRVQGGRQVNVLAGAWLCAGGFPEHMSLNLQHNPGN